MRNPGRASVNAIRRTPMTLVGTQRSILAFLAGLALVLAAPEPRARAAVTTTISPRTTIMPSLTMTAQVLPTITLPTITLPFSTTTTQPTPTTTTTTTTAITTTTQPGCDC